MKDIENVIKQIPKKGKHLLALSMGVDSVVLCDLLVKAGVDLQLVHINHEYQDLNEVMQSEAKRLADKLGLVLHSYKKHQLMQETQSLLPEALNKTNGNVEHDLRVCRYRGFAKALRESGADFLHIAHHKDDVLATRLLNFLRAQSVKSLLGLPFAMSMDQSMRCQTPEQMVHQLAKCKGVPQSPWVLRVLKQVNKEQLYAYAKQEGLTWVEDPSNQSEDFMRNVITKSWLPLLAQKQAPLYAAKQIDDELMQLLALREEVIAEHQWFFALNEKQRMLMIKGEGSIELEKKWKQLGLATQELLINQVRK